MLSSHLIADLERVCDYLVVLVASHVQLAGEVDRAARDASPPVRSPPGPSAPCPLATRSSRRATPTSRARFLVRTDQPILDPAWTVKPVTLDELVLAYMGRARKPEPAVAGPDWGLRRDPVRLASVPDASRRSRRRTDDRRRGPGADRTEPCPPLRHDRRQLRCAHDCSTATTGFTDTDGPLQVFLDFLLLAVPLLIGMFWGAPLISREFETGTFRLAWTQGVTRTRWLAVKLGLVGVASMAVAGLLSLMVTWWSSPLDRVEMGPFATFDQRDLVPIGYAAFALRVGVTAGVLIRRTLPAMAATLVGFVATHLLQPLRAPEAHRTVPSDVCSEQRIGPGLRPIGRKLGRSRFLPATRTSPTRGSIRPSSYDRGGHPLSTSALTGACPQLVSGAGPGGQGGGGGQ